MKNYTPTQAEIRKWRKDVEDKRKEIFPKDKLRKPTRPAIPLRDEFKFREYFTV